MNKFDKNNRGITLIALIVTIIVLLILAMTSVSLVLRNNLIEKAKTAKNEYEQAAKNESDELNYIEDAVNTALNGSTTSPSEGEDKGEKYLRYLKILHGLIEASEDENNNMEQELIPLLEQSLIYNFVEGDPDEEAIQYFHIDGYNYKIPTIDKNIQEISLLTNGSEESNKVNSLVEETKNLEKELNDLLIGTGYTYTNDDWENQTTAKYLESNLTGNRTVTSIWSAGMINLEIHSNVNNGIILSFDIKPDGTTSPYTPSSIENKNIGL